MFGSDRAIERARELVPPWQTKTSDLLVTYHGMSTLTLTYEANAVIVDTFIYQYKERR